MLSTLSETGRRVVRNLPGSIRKVNEDHDPVEIVSKAGSAVLISKEDYDALEETAYLLRSPVMASRLAASLDRAKRGETIERELIE